MDIFYHLVNKNTGDYEPKVPCTVQYNYERKVPCPVNCSIQL